MAKDNKILGLFMFLVVIWLSLMAPYFAKEIVEQDTDIADKTTFNSFFDTWYVVHLWVVIFITAFIFLFWVYGLFWGLGGIIDKQKIKRGEIRRSQWEEKM